MQEKYSHLKIKCGEIFFCQLPKYKEIDEAKFMAYEYIITLENMPLAT